MNPDETKLHVEFFMDTKLNKRLSAEKGRPVHDEVEKIWIRFPGDPKNDHIAPAKDKSVWINGTQPTYAERFPEHYEAFKKHQEYHGAGTPLSEAPFVNLAKRKDLEAINIYTVEALADLDGAQLKQLGMDGRELKNQAAAYLQNATDNAASMKQAAENSAMKDELSALREEMERMKAQAASAQDTAIVSHETSAFRDMDDDSLRLWMTEQGGSPDGRWSRDRLLQEADKLNASIRAAKEQAA